MDSCVARDQRVKTSAIARLEKGFSMIELFVIVLVLAILVGIAAPSFQAFYMNAKQDAMTDALYNALNYARQTALSQKISVQVCPFSALNSTSCGSNWGLGWIVVTLPVGSAVVLQSYQTNAIGPTLSAGGATSVTFGPTGLATGAQVNFKLCDTRGASFASSVMVTPTGFIQSGQTAGQAVWNGSALTCP